MLTAGAWRWTVWLGVLAGCAGHSLAMRSILALLILAVAALAQDRARRPNLVLAFADDLGRYASCYRDPDLPSPNDVIETPHLDRIAREGTRFDNAFASAPSCTPSRAALLSGRHFFRNGSHAQLHHPWHGDEPDPWDAVRGFPLALRDAGYHIGWTYKLHMSEASMGGRGNRHQPAGTRFNRFSQHVSNAEDPAAAKQALLDEVRANLRAFLAARGADQPDQPFFWWFNPTNTHRAWARGSGEALWGIDPDDLRGKLPPHLPDVAPIREDFADYLGEVLAFDAAIGVVVDELRRCGELGDTLLVISGDHGAPGFPRGKCNLYDFGTRVPLLVRWPSHVSAGRTIDVPVSLIDLAPTFLEAAAIETPASDDPDGESLWPVLAAGSDPDPAVLRGFAVTGMEMHVDEARDSRLPYPMRAIRTADHLYVINFAPDRHPVADPPLRRDGVDRRRTDLDFGPTRTWFEEHEGDPAITAAWRRGFGKRPADELYDLRTDPHQLVNLAGSPDHAAIREQLRTRLLDLLHDRGDPRVLDAAFDRPPYAPRGR